VKRTTELGAALFFLLSEDAQNNGQPDISSVVTTQHFVTPEFQRHHKLVTDNT